MQIVIDGDSNKIKTAHRKFSLAKIILSSVTTVLSVLLAILSIPVTTPEIYPVDGVLSADDPTVSIENYAPFAAFYSFDSGENIQETGGTAYDGTRINVEGQSFIQARSKSLFRWSEVASTTIVIYDDDDKLSNVTESAPIQVSSDLGSGLTPTNSKVSSEYTESYDRLPDGIQSGWGDNGGGRASLTRDEVNSGALGLTPVFNSISDSVIGDEKNFVGARLETGASSGDSNVWNGNLIEVEPGKAYRIRLYGHNDNPNGLNALAQDVRISFIVPNGSGRTIVVSGTIDSSNSKPSRYWDSVALTCKQPFHLEYVQGSALLENNAVGSDGGYALPDSVVGSECAVGYTSLDGQIPGCYQYAFYASFLVNVVAD